MSTATIEEFTAHPADYLRQVEAGQEVLLSLGGKPIARLSPPVILPSTLLPNSKPDIASRLRAQFGERCMSAEGAAAILDGVRGPA